MTSNKYLRLDQAGDALVVSPLFTFASFTEPDIGDEWQELQQRLESPNVKNVIVDLGEIPYFGSTMLEWMVQMWKRVKEKGGNLATCNASPIGLEVLSAARFDKLWGIHPSRDDARKWLDSQVEA